MKLNLNIKGASLLLLGITINSVVFAQRIDPKGNVLPKDVSKKDTINTLNAQQKTSASIADGVSTSVLGIRGRVIDVETMKPIAGVSISLSDNSKVTSTNANGEFIIPVNKKGEYKIVSSYLGYNKEITPVVLEAKNWEMVSVVLVNESSTLDEVVVTRRRVQASEFALLEERKNSNLFVEKIGAQELSRKGVSDAEGALTKMSGVTKSASGANVFVRGLGDRYNSTTFNGLNLPSEDPLNKNIALDFFGTSIIQSIAVNKTFNPLIGGDVAGANIDILSKDLTEDGFVQIGASAGVNSQAIDAKNLQRIDGTNWFGSLREKKVPIADLNSYDFNNKWNTKAMEKPINSSFSLAGGRKFKVGNGNLNVFLTSNMNSDYKYLNGAIRQTTTSGLIIRDQEMTRTQYNIAKTGMANLKYSIGNHSVSFNSLYINDQSQELEQNFGLDASREPNDKVLFRRQHVVNNKLFVNQLLSKLQLNDVWKLDLGVGYNMVVAQEPDRRTNKIILDEDGIYQLHGEANSNERYYSDIKEKGLTSKAIATYKINGSSGLDRKVEFGYQGEVVKRDFNATIIGHRIKGDRIITKDYINNIDAIFNPSKLQSGYFEQTTLRGGLEPNWYSVDKKVHSMVMAGTYQFTDRLTTILGLRYDNVYQDIIYQTNMGSTELDGPSTIKKNYVLPSLNAKYALTENSNLRASASMSYTLPQFAELAYFLNTFSNYSTQGNKDLVPVENTNVDLKWEMFPTKGELLSFGVFYKNLKNPIARSETGTNVMTYYNVGSSATVAGAEVELKKNLLKTTTTNGENVLSVGANASYLYTSQKLENVEPLFTKVHGTSALQGASPLLVNADVSYLYNAKNWNWTSTAVLNYFSDRIYSLGTRGFSDVIEKGIPTLDFISSASINKKWGVDLKVRNLLNPEFRLERETDAKENIVLESYKRGVDLSLGVSYRF